MKTCVIIPTFNESKAIGEVIRQIKKFELPVLVIDDGSRDNTSEVALQEGAIVIKNENNLGKGASLIKGFKYALDNGFEGVITMDGDGQHSPEDIPVFLKTISETACGIVIGNRMSSTKNMPFIRLLTNRFMSWLISSISEQNIPDSQCGFRLIKCDVLKQINLCTAKYETESEVLLKSSRKGFKICSVPINTIYRGEKSQISPTVDTIRFFKMLFKLIFQRRED